MKDNQYVWVLVGQPYNTIIGVYATHELAQSARLAIKDKEVFYEDDKITFTGFKVLPAKVRTEL